MKKIHWLTFSLFFAIIGITFYACRKDNTEEPSVIQAISLKEAQMIYGYVGEELTRRFGDRYRFLSPHWNHTQSVSYGAKHNVMYIPVGFDDSTGNYLHILVMKDEGRLRSLLVEMQPDGNWSRENKSITHYKKLTGHLLFYSINGRFHKGYKMKDGEMLQEYTPLQEFKNPSALLRLDQISSSGITVNGAPCTYGTFGCQELSEVVVVAGRNSSQSNYVYVYIPSTVYRSTPTGGTYSGYTWYPSGGSVSTSSPIINTQFAIITNQLTNPCLLSTFNQLTTNFGAITDIGLILKNVFGVDEGVDLQITQSTSLPNTTDGTARPYYTTIGGQIVNYKAIISLNANTLPGASREYVAATIYHEIIHGVLEVTGSMSQVASHEKMVSYVDKMANTLCALFPTLPRQEAIGLAWGGLQGTAGWSALSIAQANSYQSVNARHKMRPPGTGSICQ